MWGSNDVGSSSNFLEILFIVVSDRGGGYLSAGFGHKKNIFPSRRYCCQRCSVIVLCARTDLEIFERGLKKYDFFEPHLARLRCTSIA